MTSNGQRARRSRSPGGFTLVEVLAVLVIVSVLAMIGLPIAEIAHQRTREAELRLALRQIRTAIDAYKQAADEGRILRRANESGYPRSLSELVQGVPNLTDPYRRKLYFMRRLPRDPFAPRGSVPELTWGKRSYDSAPDAPREGADVFDVYSLAQGVGLDGIAYRQW